MQNNEKLTAFINAMRTKPSTLERIIKKSQDDRRTLNETINILLEERLDQLELNGKTPGQN